MARNFFINSIVVCVAVNISLATKAQSIHFNFSDGSNSSYSLEDIRKVTFYSDLMNLYFFDGSIYSWNVSTINYFNYDESSLNVNDWLHYANKLEARVFPNPVSSSLDIYFNLQNEDEITFILLDSQGKIILKKSIGKKLPGEHFETLEINSLSQGTYALRIQGQHQFVSKKIVKN
jgi:hypothetical protein